MKAPFLCTVIFLPRPFLDVQTIDTAINYPMAFTLFLFFEFSSCLNPSLSMPTTLFHVITDIHPYPTPPFLYLDFP